MKNAMFVGFAIGMVTGASIVASSKKVRSMVSTATEQVKSKLSKPMQSGEQQEGDSGVSEQGSNF